MKVYTVNSFAYTERGGNPAGIVIHPPILENSDYIEIAKKVGFSETAFIFPSDIADFKIRFFTPMSEVDLCGHATIASFFVLFQQNQISPGDYKMETKAGRLNIKVDQDGIVWMTQPSPKFYESVPKTEISESLNISIDKLQDKMPVEIYSTGLKDIIVPVKTLNDLNSLQPDFTRISQISKKYNTVGYHLFCIDEKGEIYCRNFAPLLGINEESATGTASGALAGYLYYNNFWQKDNNIETYFFQGFSTEKESKIDIKIQSKDDKIIKLQVGGICKNFDAMEIKI